jgi:hypothetical protein
MLYLDEKKVEKLIETINEVNSSGTPVDKK